jgi:hypothetical protein
MMGKCIVCKSSSSSKYQEPHDEKCVEERGRESSIDSHKKKESTLLPVWDRRDESMLVVLKKNSSQYSVL